MTYYQIATQLLNSEYKLSLKYKKALNKRFFIL